MPLLTVDTITATEGILGGIEGLGCVTFGKGNFIMRTFPYAFTGFNQLISMRGTNAISSYY